MKIICKKADLVKAVQTVSKAVPMKSSTTILECILLRAEKEKITLTGNNLELGIETMMSGNSSKSIWGDCTKTSRGRCCPRNRRKRSSDCTL